MKKERKEERKSMIGSSLLMFAIIILFIGVGVIALKLDAYVPIAMASLALIGYGTLYLHIPWEDLRDSIQKSVGESIECVLIILFIGCTVGTWISSGTVPYIITIGLKLFSPSFFLPCIFLICALTGFGMFKAKKKEEAAA